MIRWAIKPGLGHHGSVHLPQVADSTQWVGLVTTISGGTACIILGGDLPLALADPGRTGSPLLLDSLISSLDMRMLVSDSRRACDRRHNHQNSPCGPKQ